MQVRVDGALPFEPTSVVRGWLPQNGGFFAGLGIAARTYRIETAMPGASRVGLTFGAPDR